MNFALERMEDDTLLRLKRLLSGAIDHFGVEGEAKSQLKQSRLLRLQDG